MLGAIVFWAAYAAAAVAGLLPRLRAGGFVLLGLALACTGLAVAEGGEPRRLEVVHPHPAFVGNQVEVKDFLIETVDAPGHAYWLAGAAFCALLGAAALTGLAVRSPLLWALLFAWSGTALALVLEKLAAPASVLTLRLHGAAWLGGILASVGLAQARPRLPVFAAVLLLLSNLAWLPSAAFGTLATHYGWGTSLDVHSIEFCAHRFAGTPLTLIPGSLAQIQHLVWVPFLLVFPLLTWFSAGGVGFLVLMWKRQFAERAG